jgi:excisionase family DNA binding protein
MTAEALSERLPTSDEAAVASEAVGAMAKALTSQGALPIKLTENSNEVQLLTHIARGEMVTFVPYGAELTTQKAADILNVSRPFLTKQLEEKKIPFHRVGTHRRIRAEDLFAYKAKRDSERAEALKNLQRLGQEYDAG